MDQCFTRQTDNSDAASPTPPDPAHSRSAHFLEFLDHLGDEGLVAGCQGTDPQDMDVGVHGLLGGFPGSLNTQKRLDILTVQTDCTLNRMHLTNEYLGRSVIAYVSI